jgi:hypothetical protein
VYDFPERVGSVVGFVPVIAAPEHHPLALRSSALLIRRDERFAKAAVGWILRELSKYAPATVTVFVRENLPCFSSESLRNALTYSPEAIRRTFITSMEAAQRLHAADISARHRRRMR